MKNDFPSNMAIYHATPCRRETEPLNQDIVYYVKDNGSEELRYSLRSLSNIEHNNVWVIGDRPKWLRNIRFIPGNRFGDPWKNAFDNVSIAVNTPGVLENIVMMNDDFFIMNSVSAVPAYWLELASDTRIPLHRNSPRSEVLRGAVEVSLAHGISEPKLYTSHTPMLVEKTKMRHVLSLAPEKNFPPSWRTLYGNYWKIGGERIEDVKILSVFDGWDGRDFASTSDESFKYGQIGREVRSRFPNKSPYET